MAKRGRPTEYKTKYIEAVDKYLAKNIDIYSQDKLNVNLPTIEGFAVFIGVNKTSLYEWEEKHEDFSNALDKLRHEQQKRLINSGLSGQYNSTIAKLILSSNHGMSEKNEIDHTSKGKQINGVGVILSKAYGNDSDEDGGETA